MKNLNSILSVLVLSIISTACGNIQSGSGLNNASSNYSNGIDNSSNNGSSASQCASSPNVVGQGYNNSLQNQYRVCNAGAVGTIKLFAEDQATKNICVFPVKVVGTQIAIMPQFAKCTTITSNGTTMAFGNLSMNAAYVVDYNAVALFQQCVMWSAAGQGSLSACASQYGIGGYYGYGQF